MGGVTKGGIGDTWRQGKGEWGDVMTKIWPTWVKVKATEKVGAMPEPLIQAPRSWPLENNTHDSGPPPSA
jgi:hypothetical protein